MQEDSLPLERGVGPINFGTTPVALEDGLNELNSAQTSFLKIERVVFALCFLVMLGLCLFNVYFYLYKARMYASYPLVFSYVVLIVFGLFGTGYEFYMGFHCGE